MFFPEMVTHFWHTMKIFIAYLTIVRWILKVSYLLMIHQFFMPRKFYLTNFTLKFFKKFHFCSNWDFWVSQHALHNCPFIFQWFFGLYLIKPSLLPHTLQKSFFLLKSNSFLSKHFLQSSPSISHCNRGSHNSVTLLFIPLFTHFFIILAS